MTGPHALIHQRELILKPQPPGTLSGLRADSRAAEERTVPRVVQLPSTEGPSPHCIHTHPPRHTSSCQKSWPLMSVSAEEETYTLSRDFQSPSEQTKLLNCEMLQTEDLEFCPLTRAQTALEKLSCIHFQCVYPSLHCVQSSQDSSL